MIREYDKYRNNNDFGGVYIARKKRIWYPGAIYHIMNRGSRHQIIYQDDMDYQYCISLLEEIKERTPFYLNAYCLMPNHYHLLLETQADEIWKIMKPFNQLYTEYYNKKYSYDGPLFRGRYKAILVDSDEYFLQTSRYIHLNPVKAGIVSAPEFYAYSSYSSLIGMNHQKIVDEERILRYFMEQSGRGYRNFVEQGMGCQLFEDQIRKEVGEDELWLP